MSMYGGMWMSKVQPMTTPEAVKAILVVLRQWHPAQHRAGRHRQAVMTPETVKVVRVALRQQHPAQHRAGRHRQAAGTGVQGTCLIRL